MSNIELIEQDLVLSKFEQLEEIQDDDRGDTEYSFIIHNVKAAVSGSCFCELHVVAEAKVVGTKDVGSKSVNVFEANRKYAFVFDVSEEKVNSELNDEDFSKLMRSWVDVTRNTIEFACLTGVKGLLRETRFEASAIPFKIEK